MPDPVDRPDDRRVLVDLLATWFESHEAGDDLTPEALCKDRPDLLPALREMIGCDAQGLEALTSLNATPPSGSSAASYPRIEGFEIVAPLGAGGRGQVFLARQASLSRFVALKLLHADAANDLKARHRFLREAEIAASLDHRNIVPIHAVGESGGHAYIAMKWLPGPALDEIERPLPAKRVAQLGAAVARALHEAHRAGIIHRDVKPGNIMLDGEEPCVLDFGLARVMDDLTATADRHVSGTLPYMSPEQLRAGHAVATVDGRTDIYSLGATLYELAAGHPPFVSDEPATLIRKILLSEPRAMRGVDRDLQTILLRAIDKERERRFASAAEMADDLDRFREGRPIVSRRIGPIGRAWKLVRRHRRASSLVAASLAIAIVVGAMMLWRADRERRSIAADRRAIEVEIDRENFRLARALHDTLARRAPGDTAIVALERRLDANELLEELLDLLQDRPNAVDLPGLARHVRAIEALGGPGGTDRRRRVWRLARAAAHVLAGDRPAAQAALADVAPGRARAALLAASEGRPWPWTLPEDGKDLIEHLFTAIALRVADSPTEAIGAEIAIASSLGRTDYRAQLQSLVWEAEHAENAVAVLRDLRWLRREGRYSRTVRRTMLHQNVVLGDRAETRRLIEAFEAEFPRETWMALDAAVLFEAHLRLGDAETANRLLDRAVERWPTDWHLKMALARRCGEQGDHDRALMLVDEARGLARTRWQRDESDVARLVVRFRSIAARPSGVARIDALGTLQDEAESLADRVVDPEDRSGALVIAARAARALGNMEAADNLVKGALGACATPTSLLEAATLAYRRAEPLAADDAEECRRVAREGRAHLARLFKLRGGPWAATRDQVVQAQYLDAGLAFLAADYEGCIESARQALEAGGGLISAEGKTWLRALARRARREIAAR